MPFTNMFCAVVITHSNANTFRFDRILVPFIATNDDCPVSSPEPLVCIDTTTPLAQQTSDSERVHDYKISSHYFSAINLAFRTFEQCQILSIIEDDLLLSHDYWHVLQSYESELYLPFVTFSAINTIGSPELGPWHNDRVRVSSSTLGLAFTFNRQTWDIIANQNTWPARHWDTYLRNTYNWKSIVPEVSRAKHAIMPGATHGHLKDAQKISSMPMYEGTATLNMAPLIAPVLPHPRIKQCSASVLISNQGDYHGVFYGNNPSLFPCLAPWFSAKQRINNQEATEAAAVIDWAIAAQGQSCDDFCMSNCIPAAFDVTPNFMFIDLMTYYAGCEHVAFDMGLEIPSIDHGMCIVTDHNSAVSCATSHPSTRRLCPCLPRNPRSAAYLYINGALIAFCGFVAYKWGKCINRVHMKVW